MSDVGGGVLLAHLPLHFCVGSGFMFGASALREDLAVPALAGKKYCASRQSCCYNLDWPGWGRFEHLVAASAVAHGTREHP